MTRFFPLSVLPLLLLLSILGCQSSPGSGDYLLSEETLRDKIKGAWAAQTIGVTYGGPTEFRYLQRYIPDSVELAWSDTTLLHWMTNVPGLYDDIYMDLTFVEVLENEGLDAPAASFAKAYANARYWLWHANQQGRYNVLHDLLPPASGHWINNPHADDIDFQIEADFAGIMNPGLPNSALEVCDRVGHIMNSGDGYYGGVFVAGMYSYAFVEQDVPAIVRDALALIPGESTFHQCIADVIRWHGEDSTDWHKTWQLIEDKWGVDIGCPDGAGAPFNIDAKINAAYVVLGLLYGDGDLGKTMEVAARAGQDSDCNPATAAGILGTVLGYSRLPEVWTRGLAAIEDMDFKYTSTSLAEAYDLSFRHAQEMIRRNGGEISDAGIRIPRQEPEVAPLEQNFAGYSLKEKIPVNRRFVPGDSLIWELSFSGVGVVVRGKVGNVESPDTYALISTAETLDFAHVTADFALDGQAPATMDLPLDFIRRAHELFFRYELPQGDHRLTMTISELPPKAYLEVWDVLVYEK